MAGLKRIKHQDHETTHQKPPETSSLTRTATAPPRSQPGAGRRPALGPKARSGHRR